MNNFKNKMIILLLTLSSTIIAHGTFAASPTGTQNISSESLGVSVEQFKANFNKLASQIGAPQIKTIKLENESKGKSFAIQMPNNLALTGYTNSNNTLTRLSVGLDVADIPKADIGAHFQMLGGFAITAIKAIDQNKNDEKRDDAVQSVYESLLGDKNTLTTQNTKYKIYKNYKLSAYSHPKLGVVMIGVELNKR